MSLFQKLVDSEKFKSLSPEQQQKVRAGFFHDTVAKDSLYQSLPNDKKVKVAEQFLEPSDEDVLKDPKALSVTDQFFSGMTSSYKKYLSGGAKSIIGTFLGATPEESEKAAKAVTEGVFKPEAPEPPKGTTAALAKMGGGLTMDVSMLGPISSAARLTRAPAFAQAALSMGGLSAAKGEDPVQGALMGLLFHGAGRVGATAGAKVAPSLYKATGKAVTPQFAQKLGAVAGGATAGGATGGTEGALMGAAFETISPGKRIKGVSLQKRRTAAANTINELIKPMKKDYAYGKDPGRGVARKLAEKNKSFNTYEELQDFVTQSKAEVGQKIGDVVRSPKLKGRTFDISDALKPFDEAIRSVSKLGREANPLITRLQNSKDALAKKYRVIEGEAVPVRNRDLKNAPARAIFELKKRLGENTRWTGNPSDDRVVNAANKKAYGLLKGKLNQIAPGLKDLNEQYADLMTAEVAMKNRENINKSKASFGLYDRLSGMLGLGVGSRLAGSERSATGGVIGLITGTAINKAMMSTGVKTRVAKWLYGAPSKARVEMFAEYPEFATNVLKNKDLVAKLGDRATKVIQDANKALIGYEKRPLLEYQEPKPLKSGESVKGEGFSMTAKALTGAGAAALGAGLASDAKASENSYEPAFKESVKNEGIKMNKSEQSLMGVTQTKYNEWRKKKGLPIQNIAKLDKKEANKLYKEEFWDKYKLSKVPDASGQAIFDFIINNPSATGRVAQRIVGAEVDGVIGKNTVKKINEYIAENGEESFIEKFLNGREDFYRYLAENNPEKYGKYLKGWLNRVNSQRKLHIGKAEK